ncbi:photosystem II stability/assembly factor-like uncharacterized protein [Luteibacter sp. Sphag1AF]|uniref:WD40/YVTN/BNR-like repeat-containing protein n=1 Tax=Luteibacter sp. Sphag1AF TaxID=2587031 RepID=UPI00161DAE90|nr:YCF48-related protein [Luteibacter sp. Sphag1AF]MBB3228543.1 photosystem II stability/assembly factor-like uncharacterized protein [Luteibacter sp. Sphag1AF]
MTTRWLFPLLCGFSLAACGPHDAAAPAATAPAGPSASNQQPAYPRCDGTPHGNHCVDLSDGLNPNEYEVASVKAVDLPLKDGTHEAVAMGLPGKNAFFNDVVENPGGRIIAVGGPGLVVATRDAGPWHVMTHMPYANTLNGIAVVNGTRAFTVGDEGAILRTQDHGDHWEAFNATFADYKDPQLREMRLGGDSRAKSYHAAFGDEAIGLVVGQAGVRDTVEAAILRTNDGGKHWSRVALSNAPENVALQQVSFSDPHTAWTVGSLGTVLRSNDGGSTWLPVSLDKTDVHLMGVDFASDQHGCIGGGYKVWCTWDGGKQWQAAAVDVPKKLDDNEALALTRLRMRDQDHGWFITRDGLIFTTVDGGHRWQLWMNVVEASHGKLTGIELWGLTLGKDKAWAVGVGSFAEGKTTPGMLGSSPLLMNWNIPPRS